MNVKLISLFIAVQFLTRIPIKLKRLPNDDEMAKSLLFYPLVGLFIGLLLYGIYVLLIDANAMIRAISVLIVWVVITGALHLDGLADSADALVGGFGEKEKTLAIMKDPYCGPVGVVSLVLVLLLKFSLIYSLTEISYELLIIAPCLARSSILLSYLTTPYVRENGLGFAMAENFPRLNSLIVLVILGLLILMGYAWLGLVIILFSVLIIYLLRRVSMVRIAGMTGDTLGAQIEILEVSIILIGLVFISI